MISGWQRLKELSDRGNNMLRKVFANTRPFLKTVQTTVPTTDTLPSGWSCYYISGATKRIYHNVGGTIYYGGLT